jgi:hypothetical protein
MRNGGDGYLLKPFTEHYGVPAVGGDLLFEGVTEDDGACIDLKTPYDQRDGKFLNLDDCVTDSQQWEKRLGRDAEQESE